MKWVRTKGILYKKKP